MFMLWFLLFHKSLEVREDVSVDRRVGVWIVKVEYEGYGGESRARVRD